MFGDLKIFFLLSNVNLLNVHDVIDDVGNAYVDKVTNRFYHFVLLYIESYVMCNASKIIRKTSLAFTSLSVVQKHKRFSFILN